MAVDRTALATATFGRRCHGPSAARCHGSSGSGTTRSRRCRSIARRPRGRSPRPAGSRGAGRRPPAARPRAGVRHPGAGTSTDPAPARRPPFRRRGAAVGADVTVSAVDFPVFQERLGQGRFDSYIGAWLDEPSARGLADQWTRAGWEAHQLRPLRQPGVRRAVPARERRAGSGSRAAALHRGDGHAQRRRAGDLPLYAEQCRGGKPPVGRGGDRSRTPG